MVANKPASARLVGVGFGRRRLQLVHATAAQSCFLGSCVGVQPLFTLFGGGLVLKAAVKQLALSNNGSLHPHQHHLTKSHFTCSTVAVDTQTSDHRMLDHL